MPDTALWVLGEIQTSLLIVLLTSRIAKPRRFDAEFGWI